MNLTDVDDKTIKGSQKEGTSLKDYTERYKKAFFEDIEKLNIEKAEFYPEATNNIKEMKGKKKEILHQFARDVPKGVGKGSVVKLDREQIKEILETGAKWAVKNGYGKKEDLDRTEDYGCISGGNGGRGGP